MFKHTTHMKKKYETPIFYLEEFALSQAIAKCGNVNVANGVYPTEGDFTVCGILIDINGDGPSKNDKFLFTNYEKCALYINTIKDENNQDKMVQVQGTVVADVNLDPGVPGIYDGYCYHNPEGIKSLFAS